MTDADSAQRPAGACTMSSERLHGLHGEVPLVRAFQGFSFVVDLGFDPAARKLTIRIQNGRKSQHRSGVIIDVPPDFPGEALELLCAAFRAGDGKSATVGQAELRPPGQGL